MSTISAGTTSTTTLVHSGDTTGSLVFKTNDTGSGGTTAVTIDTSQRVGIGTASPSALLHVSSTSAETLRFQSTSSAPYQTFYNSSANRAGYMEWNTSALKIDAESGASSTMTFLTANNERMRIDSSGYLLVGCTALPSSTVAGVAFSPSVVSVNPHSFSAGSNTGVLTLINFKNGNGTVGAINTSGSNTVYATSSDYRLKKNIAPMTNSLSKVILLKPCTYKWKSDNSDGQGFIAHELAEVFPDAVVGEKDAVDSDGEIKPQQIDTSFLVATLTAAIKELKAINDQQAETINALTARVVALEGK